MSEELKPEAIALSVLKDCVGLTWDNDTDTITMTPRSFILCVQAVLARYTRPEPAQGNALEELLENVPAKDEDDAGMGIGSLARIRGWNECREALKAAAKDKPPPG
jgi:hypothetical protein